jgi:hypothetical protein
VGELSGWGSREMDGQARAVSEREASESIENDEAPAFGRRAGLLRGTRMTNGEGSPNAQIMNMQAILCLIIRI